MAPQLAWIGLGNIGGAMAKNLVQKGNLEKPLIIFNRTRKRAEDLASKLLSESKGGGEDVVVIAASLEEAVERADIVYACLTNDAATKEVVSAAIKTGVRGKLIVNCSTIHPDTTSELEEMLEGAGAEFVAAPVFGATPMAESGQLICVFAGRAAAVSRVLRYGQGVTGRANIDFSDQPPGRASLLKIVGNTFVLNMVESLAEGHALAEKSGLGCENLHAFVELFFSGPYAAYSKRMLSGDYYKREEPLMSARTSRKDAGHALDLAKKVGVTLQSVEVGDAHLAAADEYMGDRADIAGVYGAVRREAGLPYEN